MEAFQKFMNEANKSLHIADHLLYVTYPSIREVSLLIKISENIYIAMLLAIDALLSYDYAYKRISGFYPEGFSAKLDVFKAKSEQRYSIGRGYLITLLELRELIEHHRKSTIAFPRQDHYLMFSHNYSVMKGISYEKVQSYIQEAKPFIEKINRIIGNYDRLSGR